MAEIKIRGDVSGSTTIKAPDSGSDEIIELSSALGSKLPFEYSDTAPTTTTEGFLWFDDTTGSPSKPTPKFWDGSAFVPLGGKILQIVRATDSTSRATTSNTFVDASISVTITPQKSDSAILLIWSTAVNHQGTSDYGLMQITDSSNNEISGSNTTVGSNTSADFYVHVVTIGYATPATTSAVTYKGRFSRFSSGTFSVNSGNRTGQLYAIEVSA